MNASTSTTHALQRLFARTVFAFAATGVALLTAFAPAAHADASA